MNSIVPTLTANMGSGGHNVPILSDNIGIRKLTPRECFNLQGFPSTYKFGNLSDSALYKLAGNAVCLEVVQQLSKLIIKKLLLGVGSDVSM
jgi:DNA (cytosine-5)-methyltransferase 1